MAGPAQRRPVRATGCDQVSQHRRRERDGRAALPARGKNPRSANSSSHCGIDRCGRDGSRRTLPGPRICRRGAHRHVLRPKIPERRVAHPPVPGRAPCRCACAYQPGRTPRHQAIQRPRRQGWSGQASRLRYRHAAPEGRGCTRGDSVDAGRRSRSDPPLCLSRADLRRGHYHGHRRLFPGGAALSLTDGPAPNRSGPALSGGIDPSDHREGAAVRIGDDRIQRRGSTGQSAGYHTGKAPAPASRRSGHHHGQGAAKGPARALSVSSRDGGRPSPLPRA